MKYAGAIAAAVMLLFAGSAAVARKKEPSKPYAQLGQVPEDAQARSNPLEHDPDAIVAGKKLYARHCAECHGATAESGRKGPSLRAPEVQTASAGALFWVITNGNVRAGMPVWSKLPEAQRWQITTYLNSLGTAAEASTAPPAPDPVPGR
jgi:mono/diheme cytochrome c family protein